MQGSCGKPKCPAARQSSNCAMLAHAVRAAENVIYRQQVHKSEYDSRYLTLVGNIKNYRFLSPEAGGSTHSQLFCNLTLVLHGIQTLVSPPRVALGPWLSPQNWPLA